LPQGYAISRATLPPAASATAGCCWLKNFYRSRCPSESAPYNSWVLPAFVTEIALESGELRFWSEHFRDRVEGLINMAAWLQKIGDSDGLETMLADYLNELPEENAALLNFLFYQEKPK